MQKFGVTNTAIEREYFIDNNTRLKHESGPLAKGLKKRINASEALTELNPTMEAVVESFAD